jgi:hypothetical protein
VNQDLVCEIDPNILVLLVARDRQQAILDEPLQHHLKVRSGLAIGTQRAPELLAPRIRSPFAERNQAEEDPERDRLLPVGQRIDHLVRVLLDGKRQAGSRIVPEPLVIGQREQAPPPLAPQPEQRLLEQRERARLLRCIVEQA